MEVFYFRVIVLKFTGYNLKKKIALGILWQKGVCYLLCSCFFLPPVFFPKWVFCVILSRCLCQGLSTFSQPNLLLSYHWPQVFRAENWCALDNSQGCPKVTHDSGWSGFVVPMHPELDARTVLVSIHGFCVNWEAKHSREGKRDPHSKWCFQPDLSMQMPDEI